MLVKFLSFFIFEISYGLPKFVIFIVSLVTDGGAGTDEISHMPEVEQHLIQNVDGKH